MSFASAPERAPVRGGGPEGRGTATASAERGFSEANRRHGGRGTGKSMFFPGQNLSNGDSTHRGLRRALCPSCYPIPLPLSPLKWEECSPNIPGATEHFRRRRRAGGETRRRGQVGVRLRQREPTTPVRRGRRGERRPRSKKFKLRHYQEAGAGMTNNGAWIPMKGESRLPASSCRIKSGMTRA